ncbi:MAG: RluA family pseudouridine synthase [Cyanobacteria bacterium J06643_4]
MSFFTLLSPFHTASQYDVRLAQLKETHRRRKEGRDRRRAECKSRLQGVVLEKALGAIAHESQQDGSERRRLKQERDEALRPLDEVIGDRAGKVRSLKQDYKTLSSWWQMQVQAVYVAQRIAERRNDALVLEDLMEQIFSQVVLSSSADDFDAARVQQQLLSFPKERPLPSAELLRIVYQDGALIVVDKPAGLLSVPGRRYRLQDSVLSRLRYQLPKCSFLQAVHRLDQATSGLLVIAKSAEVHASLSKQFAQRKVVKTYGAVLSKPVTQLAETIALPLYADPTQRPRQVVDEQRGKPSKTVFRIIEQGEHPHVEFSLCTGRTHQLRVHAAHPKGLNSPILGDRLYGCGQRAQRLWLHSAALAFVHPVSQSALNLRSQPFFW